MITNIIKAKLTIFKFVLAFLFLLSPLTSLACSPPRLPLWFDFSYSFDSDLLPRQYRVEPVLMSEGYYSLTYIGRDDIRFAVEEFIEDEAVRRYFAKIEDGVVWVKYRSYKDWISGDRIGYGKNYYGNYKFDFYLSGDLGTVSLEANSKKPDLPDPSTVFLVIETNDELVRIPFEQTVQYNKSTLSMFEKYGGLEPGYYNFYCNPNIIALFGWVPRWLPAPIFALVPGVTMLIFISLAVVGIRLLSRSHSRGR